MSCPHIVIVVSSLSTNRKPVVVWNNWNHAFSKLHFCHITACWQLKNKMLHFLIILQTVLKACVVYSHWIHVLLRTMQPFIAHQEWSLVHSESLTFILLGFYVQACLLLKWLVNVKALSWIFNHYEPANPLHEWIYCLPFTTDTMHFAFSLYYFLLHYEK